MTLKEAIGTLRADGRYHLSGVDLIALDTLIEACKEQADAGPKTEYRTAVVDFTGHTLVKVPVKPETDGAKFNQAAINQAIKIIDSNIDFGALCDAFCNGIDWTVYELTPAK